VSMLKESTLNVINCRTLLFKDAVPILFDLFLKADNFLNTKLKI